MSRVPPDEQAKRSTAMAWLQKIPLYLYWELKSKGKSPGGGGFTTGGKRAIIRINNRAMNGNAGPDSLCREPPEGARRQGRVAPLARERSGKTDGCAR